ncbi:Alpha/Beta hydrolase protein [Pelagophyceae sp. CCMP2097]|nr:Alpha/Beta hydrolase protein [Pelagophyceae sp. CCMP2097]|mmetsp:Transcript_8980/g.29673  ORF Transcript_8980/g.29673 Transcript_8980/m.29673 type:complete len:383 (-) Transcript_8980:140-1288(-)
MSSYLLDEALQGQNGWDASKFYLDSKWLERCTSSSGKIESGGFQLAWACVKAEGQRPAGRACIVSTGWNESFLRYASVAKLLHDAGYHEVWLYDHRCQGLSSRDSKHGQGTTHVESFEDYLEDASAVLDHFTNASSVKKFDVVAHSLGGAIWTHRILRELQGRLGRAVFCAPMYAPKMTAFPSSRYWDHAAANLVAFIAQKLLPRRVFKTLTLEGQARSACLRHGEGEAAWQQLLHLSPHLAAPYVTMVWAVAAVSVYAETQSAAAAAPPGAGKGILVLSAGRDYMVFSSAHGEVVELIGGRLLRLDEASHEIFHEKPIVRATALRAMLDHLLDAKTVGSAAADPKVRHVAAFDEKFLMLPAFVAYAAAIAAAAALVYYRRR